MILRLKHWVVHSLRRVRAFRRWSRSRTTRAGLKYGVISTAFDREFKAVHAGIGTYQTSVSDDGETQALLRRNIHRLEKGLLMRPRRETFAAGYIQETVDCLESRLSRTSVPDESIEIKWAADVLRSYFAVNESHPSIDQARHQFEALSARLPGDGELVPYHRDLKSTPSVSFEDLLELSTRRRSVRWFLDQPVPRDLVEQAMEVALQAPSACNRQPFTFLAFDEPETVEEVSAVPMGTAGYSDNIPTIIVVVGQLRNFFDERDRHLIYIDGALAAMGFALALETLGLSSCLINWPDMPETEERMQRLLDLDPDERPVFLIAVGFPDPDALVANSTKKPVHEVLRFRDE